MAPPLADPAVFRQAILIDASGAAVPFRPDPWQEADFRAMDPAWQFAAGRWSGPPPTVRRAWQERPRGHSKTSDLAVMVTWALLMAERPIRGIAASGDRDQAKLLRDAIATLARMNDWVAALLDVQAWCVVNRRNGATLDILSSDVGTSYGQLADFIAIDEVSHWPQERGRLLWDALVSTAAKRANCLLICILNAGFTEHFAYRIREAVRTDPAWHFSHLDGPLASWITPDRLAEQERLLPGPAYERLWLNRWSSGTGDALNLRDITAAVRQAGPMTGAESDYWFFGGCDLSVTRDTAAVVIVGKDQYGRLRLAAIRAWVPPRGGQVDLMAVRDEIIALHRRFRCTYYFDIHQGALLAQEAGKCGVWMEPIPFQGAAATEMATALIEAFRDHNIEIFDDEALIADLKRLRIEERPSGWRLAANRTSAGHCDRATALVLALLAAKRSPASAPMPGDALLQAMRQHQQSEPTGFRAMERRYQEMQRRAWTPRVDDDDEDDENSGWEHQGGGWHGGRR